MNTYRIALTTWDPEKISIDDVMIPATDAGFVYEGRNLNHTQDADRVIRTLEDVDYIIAGSERLDATVLPHLKRLKFIARNGAGYDNVDLKCASELGIGVGYIPGANSKWVAESTLALMLAVMREIPYKTEHMRAGDYHCGWNMNGSLFGIGTVGLIGFGNIARELARLYKPFGMRIMAYDPFVPAEKMAELGVEKADLDEVLAESSAISLHLPVTPETVGMVNKDFIAKMKDGAYLVNTARGSLVNEQDLYKALKNGKLAGAGLDVFSSEQICFSPLFTLENVALTPHTSARPAACWRHMVACSLENILNFHRGEDVRFLLNPEYREHAKKI